MANILFIVQNKNFVTSALALQLERQGHSITVVSNNIDKIQGVQEQVNMVLISMEDTVPEDVFFFKEHIFDRDIPVMLIGDSGALREIAPVIPVQFIKKHFQQPINSKEITEYIASYERTEASHPKKKILVVDDSGAMLRNIKGWLEDKYQVILANSGASAIKSLAMYHPDLVLLDYEMPVCDGKQVLEMIRAEEEFAEIPVMFLTSKSDRESVESVTSLKPEGYLIKIMEPRCIVQSIDNFFKREEIRTLKEKN